MLNGSKCITGARFTMRATLLHQNDPYVPDLPDLSKYGEYVNSQDPLTKEIIQVWKKYEDDPDTPENEEITLGEIHCLARGIVDGGIRVAGTTERFDSTYENIDYVKMWLPSNFIITKRDRVTNIKDASGHIRWLDEEYVDKRESVVAKATVFNVNGVTPLFDAFNNIVEQFVLLERAEIQ